MSQTPAKMVQQGSKCVYTFAADAAAGDVVEVGSIPAIVVRTVDFSEQPDGTVQFDGVWDVPQVAGIITAGDAVYWDSNGSPYGGTALSGCATGTASGNNLMGVASPVQPNGTNATTATDSYVRVKLTAASRTTTVSGSLTTDDITGSDATLTITGKSAAAGGTVVIAAGAGSAGVGGVASVTGGAGTGAAGGAASLVGGAGGAASAGGAVTVAGGVPASGNAAGGAASVTGGAGSGTGAGGAVSIVSGASGAGATGNGGLISITGGAAGSTNGNGGSIALTPGALAGTGVAGMIRNVGVPAFLNATVTAKTTAATLTIAELLTGMLTGTHTAGATQAYTLPTGTLCTGGTACGDTEGFFWHLINLSTAAADSITVTAGADHTLVGEGIVISKHATTGGSITSMGGNSARFFTKKSTGNTWVTYRCG